MRRAPAGAGPTGASFLDPKVLARIDNLELLARTVVDGFLSGLHRSPYLGVSMEFAEHRSYMPGDDIRRIDWRVFARTDRFYVKQFEADTNANVAFLVDVSRSMDFGTGPVTKLDYARFLSACLAWFSASQRDRVGLYTYDSAVVEHVPCSLAHLDLVLHALARSRAERPGSMTEPLRNVGQTFRRRGCLVVVSDFYEEPGRVGQALGELRARGHDIIAFHVLDPAEIDFPFEQASTFQDLETREVLPVVPESATQRYRTLINEHVERVGSVLRSHRIDHILLNASKPLDEALFRYLTIRERATRVR